MRAILIEKDHAFFANLAGILLKHILDVKEEEKWDLRTFENRYIAASLNYSLKEFHKITILDHFKACSGCPLVKSCMKLNSALEHFLKCTNLECRTCVDISTRTKIVIPQEVLEGTKTYMVRHILGLMNFEKKQGEIKEKKFSNQRTRGPKEYEIFVKQCQEFAAKIYDDFLQHGGTLNDAVERAEVKLLVMPRFVEDYGLTKSGYIGMLQTAIKERDVFLFIYSLWWIDTKQYSTRPGFLHERPLKKQKRWVSEPEVRDSLFINEDMMSRIMTFLPFVDIYTLLMVSKGGNNIARSYIGNKIEHFQFTELSDLNQHRTNNHQNKIDYKDRKVFVSVKDSDVAIKTYDHSDVKESIVLQLTHNLKSLNLRNIPFVTDKFLDDLAPQLKHLEFLDLTRVEGIYRFSDTLMKSCVNLKHLAFSGLNAECILPCVKSTSLVSLEISSFMFRSLTYLFGDLLASAAFSIQKLKVLGGGMSGMHILSDRVLPPNLFPHLKTIYMEIGGKIFIKLPPVDELVLLYHSLHPLNYISSREDMWYDNIQSAKKVVFIGANYGRLTHEAFEELQKIRPDIIMGDMDYWNNWRGYKI